MYLEPSRYEELNQEVADLIETYEIQEYPLDVFALANRMGIKTNSYSSTFPAKAFPFASVSKDAFTVTPSEYKVESTFIYYNQNAVKGRLAQSIAHEIAHIWLEHPSDEEPYETEAEYFAAYLLAPIPVIIKLGLSSISEVQACFGVSYQAAKIALRRAENRCRCGKAGFEYEYQIIDMCKTKVGDALEIA